MRGQRGGQSFVGRFTWIIIAGIALLALIAITKLWSPTVSSDDHHDANDQVPVDDPPDEPPPPIEHLRVNVLHRYPHRTDAFTQGLVWSDGKLYESTGLEQRSSLRLVDLRTGEIVRRRDIDPTVFAEGLALVGDRLFQISWQDHRCFVWNKGTFDFIREHHYDGEGWGLAYDGTSLIMSDGSDRLFFRNPETFQITRAIRVRMEDRPLRALNELEYVDGQIWANVWQRNIIVRIDPRTANVTAVVRANGLLTPEERRGTDVLNGIAWMPQEEHFLITGKEWPWLFEVEFVPDGPQPTP